MERMELDLRGGQNNGWDPKNENRDISGQVWDMRGGPDPFRQRHMRLYRGSFYAPSNRGDEESWSPLSMALLPKVARPTQPKQFRAIELAHALAKLWDSILESKLREYVTEEDNPAWAYAWQSGRQTTDLAQILRCTLQGCEAKGTGCVLGG